MRSRGEELSNELLIRYLLGEMTRSESEETERLVADSRRAQQRLAELRAMTDELGRPPGWVASVDLTAAVEQQIRKGAATTPARQPRRAIWWSAGLATAVAAVAVALVIAPWRSHEPGEPRAKGGAASDPDRWVGIALRTGGGEPIGERIPRGELAITYTNLGPRPYSHLMVFAVDATGEVRWFYPAWQDAAANPTAIAIEAGVADRLLPDAVEHPFPPGGVVVCGLFLRRAASVREIEAAIAGTALTARSRLSIADSGQHCIARMVE